MSSLAELRQKIAEQGGPRLTTTDRTSSILIDKDVARGYFAEVIGPFEVEGSNGDLRAFMNHRELEGTKTVTILFQDADDDIFLNHDAEGLEQYTGANPGGIYYIN